MSANLVTSDGRSNSINSADFYRLTYLLSAPANSIRQTHTALKQFPTFSLIALLLRIVSLCPFLSVYSLFLTNLLSYLRDFFSSHTPWPINFSNPLNNNLHFTRFDAIRAFIKSHFSFVIRTFVNTTLCFATKALSDEMTSLTSLHTRSGASRLYIPLQNIRIFLDKTLKNRGFVQRHNFGTVRNLVTCFQIFSQV